MISLSTLTLSESSPDSDREPSEHKYEINSYFVDNPSHVLGDWSEVLTRRGRALSIRGRGDVQSSVCEALEWFALSLPFPPTVNPTEPIEPAYPEPLSTPSATEPELAALEIYSAAKALLSSKVAESATPYNRALAAYQAFTTKWGTLRGAFQVARGAKPGGILVATELAHRREAAFLISLETPQGKLSALLTEPVRGTAVPSGPLSLADALLVSLDETGGIDPARISALTLTEPDEALTQLLSAGLIFRVPPGCLSHIARTCAASAEYIPASDYLTGDIGSKLKVAQAAGPTYAANVLALTQALPDPLSHEEISVGLGAEWVPSQVFTDWAYTLFPGETWGLTVEQTPSKSWVVECTNPSLTAADSAIRTKRVSGLDLISAALNNQMPVVYDEYKGADGWPVKVRNEPETLEACARVAELRSKFDAWVWGGAVGKSGETGEERTNRLAAIYNGRFNTHAERDLSGDHLTFDGLATTVAGARYELKSRQRRGVAKILVGGTRDKSAYLVYPPGFGKTDPAICAAVKLRQLGLSNRALFTVPKSTVGQWSARFLALFPGLADEVLCAVDPVWGSGSGARERDVFLNRIATGGWSYVIISHEMLREILLTPESYDLLLREELAELRDCLREAETSNMSRDATRQAKRSLRERQGALERASVAHRSKWEKLREGGRLAISWEDCGIDHLVVDECLPSSTLILTQRGLTHINKVKLSDYVLSYSNKLEWKRVINCFKKQLHKPLLEIAHTFGKLYLTEDHQIHTPTGYVTAKTLRNGDCINVLREMPKTVYSEKIDSNFLQSALCRTSPHRAAVQTGPIFRPQLRNLRKVIQFQSNKSQIETSPFLWKKLLGKMAHGSAGNEKNHFSSAQRKTEPSQRHSESRSIYLYEIKQSNQEARSVSKNERFFERSYFSCKRGQRQIDRSSSYAGYSLEFAYGSGNQPNCGERSFQIITESLQSRYWGYGFEISNRGGWVEPQNEEMAIFGSSQRRNLACARVDSVTFLEPGSAKFIACGAGTGYVYDLEVEDNHNYFADGVLVHNCHSFKALGVSTRMECVSGLPSRESARAYDAWAKFQTVFRVGGRVTCLSGTPLTNTLAEAYVWQKMLQPSLLRHLGLYSFDAWASVFAEAYSAIELDCTGKFRSVTKLRFRNVPELVRLLGEAWDYVRE